MANTDIYFPQNANTNGTWKSRMDTEWMTYVEAGALTAPFKTIPTDFSLLCSCLFEFHKPI